MKFRGEREKLIDILYEDKDVIVIDKSEGVLSTHTRLQGRSAREGQFTVENALTDYVRKGQLKSSKKVFLVHRLDRETSGVMMVAKSEEVMNHFRDNWNELTEKTYLAWVEGEMPLNEGAFESYLMDDPKTFKVRSVSNPKFGKFARTEWKCLAKEDGKSLMMIRLKSGRKNQIRVHFSENGHPIVGDVKYGGMKAKRLYLHSLKLEFIHPRTGERMSFQSRQNFRLSSRVDVNIITGFPRGQI